jgi:2-iminobutanoate/2-iminopropanoate deaminase
MVEKIYYDVSKNLSEAVKAGNIIYTAGIVPVDAKGNLIGTDITQQTNAVLENIKKILEDLGAKLTDIVKCTILLTDIKNFAQMNEAYVKFFTDHGCAGKMPARATMEIVKLVKSEWLLEVEVVAVI